MSFTFTPYNTELNASIFSVPLFRLTISDRLFCSETYSLHMLILIFSHV